MKRKKPDDKKPTTNEKTGEPISATESYGLAEFKRRTQLGDWALRQAKRAGLRVIHVGGRAFIRGRDWHRFLGQNGDSPQ